MVANMVLNSELVDAVLKCDTKKIKKLLKNGADPNSQRVERINEPFSGSDDYYYNVLSIAIKLDSIKIVKILLESGADPCKKDEYGSALECAVLYCRKDIVKLLLEKGRNYDNLSELIKSAQFDLGLTEKHYPNQKNKIKDLREIIKVLQNC